MHLLGRAWASVSSSLGNELKPAAPQCSDSAGRGILVAVVTVGAAGAGAGRLLRSGCTSLSSVCWELRETF